MAEEKEKQAVVVKDIGQKAMNNLLAQVGNFASNESTPLTSKEKAFASDIIGALVLKVNEEQIPWNQINVSELVLQVKSYARLGLSISDGELWIDIRKNSNTGLKNVTIKKQYQGIEKELIKWCKKPIVRFLDGIICEGDDFQTEKDFEKGLLKIVAHKENHKIDRNDLKNITGAYKIAYILENGVLVQYAAIIDKNRIMRAYNAALTKKIWDADTTRMVIKTASWVLYNNVLKPFIEVPIELKKDFEATSNDDDLDFDGNIEVEAQEEINANANKGETIGAPEEEPKVNPQTGEVNAIPVPKAPEEKQSEEVKSYFDTQPIKETVKEQSKVQTDAPSDIMAKYKSLK